jgi:Uma2 family endonuclease
MNTLIDSPPRTIMELYKSLPEGTLAELIDNTIYMSPAPKFNHQIILQEIFRVIVPKIKDNGLGQVIIAPFDVYLDEKSNAVQPDLTIVLNDNLNIIGEDGSIHGVPDLLIEVLSKGSETNDTVKKFGLYERFGVKEYWIVEPVLKSATGYSLVDGRYKKLNEETGIIRSPLLKAVFMF